jgi:hypothetical protein
MNIGAILASPTAGLAPQSSIGGQARETPKVETFNISPDM